MNATIVALFSLGILLGASGAICMKIGAQQLTEFSPTLQYAGAFFLNPYIASGFLLYFIPALIWTYLLAKLPVSVVQPILALTYVVTPLLAMLFLSEPVPLMRWFGIFVIVGGVAIVAST